MSRHEGSTFLDVAPLGDGFGYWLSICPPGDVPLKQNLDPLTMPTAVLPWTFIYQRTVEGRYLCRLMGTGACSVFGYDPTGRHVDQLLPPDKYAARRKLFDECLETGSALGYAGMLAVQALDHIPYRRLLLPLRNDGRTDHIFGLVVFPTGAPQRKRRTPLDVDLDVSVWRYDPATGGFVPRPPAHPAEEADPGRNRPV